MNEKIILTIGHSTLEQSAFIDLLGVYSIKMLVDVRTIPRSRHNPQFNRDVLPGALSEAGIEYLHAAGLGGLRKTVRDSPNTGWRNLAFRGFADYMQTPEFEENLSALIELARFKRVVIMCAEAVPWRCHRSLLSDALVVRGWSVHHILSAARTDSHRLTSFARVEGNRILYPGEPILFE